MTKPVWPAGLMSLRRFVLGMTTVFEDTRRSTELLPIFTLPTLEAVHIRGLEVTETEVEGINVLSDFGPLASKSSSARHLCLEDVVGYHAEHAVGNMISACRNLETLVLCSCDMPHNFDWLPSQIT